MSNRVNQIVLERKVGSPTRKAVLVYMAYRASDDGSGFWAGKSRMARELEMNQRTVKFCIKDLLATGLISAVGKRPCSGGHTIIYQLNLKAILALEPANAAIDDKFEESRGLSSQGVNDVHPPSETDSPKGVHDVPPPVKQIHPRWCMTFTQTILQPSKNQVWPEPPAIWNLKTFKTLIHDQRTLRKPGGCSIKWFYLGRRPPI